MTVGSLPKYDLDERVKHLERQALTLKRWGALALILAVCPWVLLGARVSQKADMRPIEASAFVVKDPNGARRAVLEVTESGTPALRLLDREGRHRVALGVMPDGSGLLGFLRPDGKSDLRLYSGGDEVTLELRGGATAGRIQMRTGRLPSLVVLTPDGNSAVMLATMPDGSGTLMLANPEGDRLVLPRDIREGE